MMLRAPGASAHNWMHTPGRARKEASTLRPCRGRKSSDTHAQVGPGQTIVVKTATGHVSRPTRGSYLLVVPGKDAHWLGNASLMKMVAQYIADAPANSNVATAPETQRYHGVRASTKVAPYDSMIGTMYSQKIASTSKYFLDHPFEKTNILYQYNQSNPDSGIDRDRFVSYKSTDFPWLESVYRYDHLVHHASDYDAIRVSIPARKGPGHYIVHWRWSGYSECVDVDVFPNKVQNVYGVDTGKYVFNRIDHCQYVDYRRVLTGCHKVAGNAKECVKHLNTGEWSRSYNMNRRIGVNVVPVGNPVATAFPNEASNIEWTNYTCSPPGNTINGLSAKLTTNAVDWAKWRATIVKQTSCPASNTLWEKKAITLRDAVLKCTTSKCAGISAPSATALSALYTGTHTFRGCARSSSALYLGGTQSQSSAGLTSDSAWTTYLKKLPVISNSSVTPIAKVSFSRQPLTKRGSVHYAVALSAGFTADHGQAYGKVKGTSLYYGWKCGSTPVNVSTSPHSPYTIAGSSTATLVRPARYPRLAL